MPAVAVTKAGGLTPVPFGVWSVVTPVAETGDTVPLMVFPVRNTVVVPVLKSITAFITIPVPIASVRALSCFAVVASHSGAMHREAIHLSAVAGPRAAAMEAATAARQRMRAAKQYSSEANDGNGHQCFCGHRSLNMRRWEYHNTAVLSPRWHVISIGKPIQFVIASPERDAALSIWQSACQSVRQLNRQEGNGHNNPHAEQCDAEAFFRVHG